MTILPTGGTLTTVMFRAPPKWSYNDEGFGVGDERWVQVADAREHQVSNPGRILTKENTDRSR